MRSLAVRASAGDGDGSVVHVAWTERADGDLSADVAPEELHPRHDAVVARPWVWVRQVHGADVIEVVDGPLDAVLGVEADAMVTRRTDVALSVRSADCATLALWSDAGVIAAVHCGWRGLVAGVLESTVRAMREVSGRAMRDTPDATIHAVLGPSIGPECYEFGAADLATVRSIVGDVVVGLTADGRPALDVRAGVRSTLERLDVDIVASDERCTACEADAFHSHRARGETGRQALVVWIESR